MTTITYTCGDCDWTYQGPSTAHTFHRIDVHLYGHHPELIAARLWAAARHAA